MYEEEQFERNDIIVKKVLQGIPMAEVGREYGVSRQRIEQIFKRANVMNKNLVPIGNIIKKEGVSRTTLINGIKKGQYGTKIGNKYYVYKEEDTSKKCAKCDTILLNRRARYCSIECMEKDLKESQLKRRKNG